MKEIVRTPQPEKPDTREAQFRRAMQQALRGAPRVPEAAPAPERRLRVLPGGAR